MKYLSSLRSGRALLAALALGFAATSAALAADGTRYYVNDHLATTVGIADAAGEIAAIEADAFGSPIAGGANAGRFTGKPYDEDLGAYVFPFRNYRADEARWMSADPSGFPDGVNGRFYIGNPFSTIDALGLATISANTQQTFSVTRNLVNQAANAAVSNFYNAYQDIGVSQEALTSWVHSRTALLNPTFTQSSLLSGTASFSNGEWSDPSFSMENSSISSGGGFTFADVGYTLTLNISFDNFSFRNYTGNAESGNTFTASANTTYAIGVNVSLVGGIFVGGAGSASGSVSGIQFQSQLTFME
jgi:RHS repeat-associated protein